MAANARRKRKILGLASRHLQCHLDALLATEITRLQYSHGYYHFSSTRNPKSYLVSPRGHSPSWTREAQYFVVPIYGFSGRIGGRLRVALLCYSVWCASCSREPSSGLPPCHRCSGPRENKKQHWVSSSAISVLVRRAKHIYASRPVCLQPRCHGGRLCLA